MVDDLAVLQYTGGTTGVAKGVMLSHSNLVANIDQITAWVPAFQRGKERFLCVAPFFHVLDLTGNMNQSVCCGFTMIVLPRFELKMFLKTIAKTRPTVAVLVPTIITAMVNAPDIAKYDLTSINYVVSGSAPLPVEIIRPFEELTGSVIIEGYGLTETAPLTHGNPMKETRKPGSVGIRRFLYRRPHCRS